jgi:DNA-binding NarL/FixJ family response regulator
MYSIIIVDDHLIFRTGLKLLLGKIKDVKVVAEASNGRVFLEMMDKYRIDLVFMDINMPELDGIETTFEALKKNPDLKIIGLTSYGNDEYFNKMVCAGVEGFMLKNSELDDFKKAIPRVIEGGNYFSDELLMNFTRNFVSDRNQKKQGLNPELTEREKEVLALICKGYSNDKIGKDLFISGRSVERYKTILLDKTKTLNTVNLVIYAFKNKLVDL